MLQTFLVVLMLGQVASTHLPRQNSKELRALQIRLQQRVQDYSVGADNFAEALIKVGSQFKLPMGLQWVRIPSATKPVHLSWKAATVRKVIQDIVHTQPGYEIQLRNAIVHVYPRKMIPERENFLKLKVPEFNVQNQVTEIASRRLGEYVALKVSPREPTPAHKAGEAVYGSLLTEMDDLEISVSLNNASVEDILDAISLASPFKVWLVTFADDGSLTPTGFHRTVSPVVPDQYQPFWELLKWGRTPY